MRCPQNIGLEEAMQGLVAFQSACIRSGCSGLDYAEDSNAETDMNVVQPMEADSLRFKEQQRAGRFSSRFRFHAECCQKA